MKRILAAGLCLGLSLGAGAAFKHPKPPPAWTRIDAKITDRDLASVYRSVLFAATDPNEQTPELERWLANPGNWPTDRGEELVVGNGPFAGHWRFIPWREQWPVAAIHLSTSKAPPYSVTIETYCQPGFEHCDMLDWRVGELAAPEPDAGAPAQLIAEWEGIVLSETCTHSKGWDFGVMYPEPEAKAGIGGSVELEVLYNPCGDIRGATILRSSGNANLDSAAIDSVKRNRIQRLFGKSGGRMHQTVVFDPKQVDETWTRTSTWRSKRTSQ